jgi:hypothetical protein
MDHGLDLGSGVVIPGDQGRTLGYQRLLPVLEGQILLAQLAALFQELPEMFFKALQVFSGLFEGIHVFKYSLPGTQRSIELPICSLDGGLRGSHPPTSGVSIVEIETTSP